MCSICDSQALAIGDHHAPAYRDGPKPVAKRARKAKRAKVAKGSKAKSSKRAPKKSVTHEQYIASIYNLALKQPHLTDADRKAIASIKLTYGAGPDGTRGVTYYNRWQKTPKADAVCMVAICATGQESHLQVCGTTLHELGHVMTGIGHGHSGVWLDACCRIGLGRGAAPHLPTFPLAKGSIELGDVKPILAAGTTYDWAMFHPGIRKALQDLPTPTDGAPIPAGAGLAGIFGLLGAWGATSPKLRPCGAGFGVKGGKSRGAGSKSRLLLWECKCEPVVKIRHAGRELDCTCNKCKKPFELVEASLPPAHTNGGQLAPAPKIKRATRRPAKGPKAKQARRRHNKAGSLRKRAKPSELAHSKALRAYQKPL